jgi:hypothetical protein
VGQIGSTATASLRFTVVGLLLSAAACAGTARALGNYRVGGCPTDTPVGDPTLNLASSENDALLKGGQGALVVRAFGTGVIDGERLPLYESRFVLNGPARVRRDTTVREGAVRFALAPGPYQLRIQGSTYRDWSGSADVRLGREDTLKVFPGRHVTCLTPF